MGKKLIALSLAVGMTVTTAGGYLIGDATDWIFPEYSTVEKVENTNNKILKVLNEVYPGKNIVEVSSVTTRKSESATEKDMIDVTARAVTAKGKKYSVIFTFQEDITKTSLTETIDTLTESTSKQVKKIQADTELGSLSEKKLNKLGKSIISYMETVANYVETYKDSCTYQEMESAEILQETITNSEGNKTYAPYTGKGLLEASYKYIASKGLGSKQEMDTLHENVKDVISDTEIELQTSIIVDLTNNLATVGAQIGNIFQYLEIDIESVATSTNTAEAKQQAIDYVLALLKAAETNNLTSEQLATITECQAADLTSNTLFTIATHVITYDENINNEQ